MPSRISLSFRILSTVVITAAGLLIIGWLSDSLTVDSVWAAIVASICLGIVNAFIAPALAYFTLPLSVATVGIASVVINGLLIALILMVIPGIEISSLVAGIVIAIGLTIVHVAVTAVTAIDDDYWFDSRMRRRAGRKVRTKTAKPGIVFVQIDGLAHGVLQRAMRNGNAPNLFRMVHEEGYALQRWRTDWSSQTGASQAGILLGSNDDMPAFRWIDKQTRRRFVSNHPEDAQAIERLRSSGPGLLADDGASFGNLFAGSAQHGLMTISAVGKRKSGGFGAGYGQYFARPYNATRTAVRFTATMLSELHNARVDRRRKIEPRVHRGLSFAFARSFTCTVMTDVCITGALEQMAGGRTRIYIDLLSYDEIAHHCGVERSDALIALQDIDRQIGRLMRFSQWTQRPYRFVVLSDHGQSAGVPFAQEFGETLAELIGRSTQAPTRADEEELGEATTFVNPTPNQEKLPVSSDIEVLYSGNLGLVYLMTSEKRLTEREIVDRWPSLIKDLAGHPGIGFVLVADDNGDGIVIGRNGRLNLRTSEVDGVDPLAAFGELAHERVRRTHAFGNVADLMINGAWDPTVGLTFPFENFVGSHGGMGGDQSEGFVMSCDAAFPNDVFGAGQLHRLLDHYAEVITREERV